MLLARFCLFNKLISSPTLNLRPLPPSIHLSFLFVLSQKRTLPVCCTGGRREGEGYVRVQICRYARACACERELCSLSSEAVGVRMGGRIYRRLLLSSLFIQLQISEHTHYLPFMGWQVLVKITIFRMDRLELSLLPRYPVSPRLFPMYIYIYINIGDTVYGVFYQSRYGFLANFFARWRDAFAGSI